MPNWCDTTLHICAPKPMLDELEDFLNTENKDMPWFKGEQFRSGGVWIYDILKLYGVSEEKERQGRSEMDGYCDRGYLVSYDRYDDCNLCIYFDTAWGPCTQFTDFLRDKLADFCEKEGTDPDTYGYGVSWKAEEDGNVVYEKDDPLGVFPEEWIFSFWPEGDIVGDGDTEYCESDDEMCEVLASFLEDNGVDTKGFGKDIDKLTAEAAKVFNKYEVCYTLERFRSI